jgi:hypothetical protein
MAELAREIRSDGTVVLRGERVAFFYQRPRPGLVLIKIVGAQLDDGALGSAPSGGPAGFAGGGRRPAAGAG